MDGVAKSFKLAAADVLEANAVWTGGGGLVEVNGNLGAAPDLHAGLAG